MRVLIIIYKANDSQIKYIFYSLLNVNIKFQIDISNKLIYFFKVIEINEIIVIFIWE